MTSKTMNSLETAKLILITGRPGIGKTTLISRLFDHLKHESSVRVHGFKTEEIRDARNPRSGRLGFDVIQLDPDAKTECRSRLARVGSGPSGEVVHGPRVGQYSVDVSSFEQLAIPCLQLFLDKSTHSDSGFQVCIVDEIGKMESYSHKFTNLIHHLVDSIESGSLSRTIVLATVPCPKRPDGTRGINLVDYVCARPDACLVEVTFSNRDALVTEIFNAIRNRFSV